MMRKNHRGNLMRVYNEMRKRIRNRSILNNHRTTGRSKSNKSGLSELSLKAWRYSRDQTKKDSKGSTKKDSKRLTKKDKKDLNKKDSKDLNKNDIRG